MHSRRKSLTTLSLLPILGVSIELILIVEHGLTCAFHHFLIFLCNFVTLFLCYISIVFSYCKGTLPRVSFLFASAFYNINFRFKKIKNENGWIS